MLDLPTAKIIRSVISSEAFAIFPFRAETPHAFQIPNCTTTHCLQNFSPTTPPPPLPRNPKMLPLVWYGCFLELPIHCQSQKTVNMFLFTPLKNIVSRKARSNVHNFSTQHVYYNIFGNKVLSVAHVWPSCCSHRCPKLVI